MARPTAYTAALADRIVELIASGKSERQIAKMEGMPCRRTIMNWKTAHPEFLRATIEARAASAEIFNDRRMEKAQRLYEEAMARMKSGEGFPRGVVEAVRASMQEDAREAAMRDDSRFGDRRRLALTGADDGALRIETAPDLSGVSTEDLLKVRALLYGQA